MRMNPTACKPLPYCPPFLHGHALVMFADLLANGCCGFPHEGRGVLVFCRVDKHSILSRNNWTIRASFRDVDEDEAIVAAVEWSCEPTPAEHCHAG